MRDFFHRAIPLSIVLSLVGVGLFFQNCSRGFDAPQDLEQASTAATPFLFPDKPHCVFNGAPLAEGASQTAYLNSTPDYTNGCVSETRVCKDGILSGTFTYAFCKAGLKACLFNGITVASGESVTAYSASVNSQCNSETRTCTDGRLSGSFAYSSCKTNICLFNGVTYQAGAAFTYYPKATAISEAACQAQTGYCQLGGVLVDAQNQALPDSIYASCSVHAASCLFQGTTLTEEQTFEYVPADSSSCQTKTGFCDSNGRLRDSTSKELLPATSASFASCFQCLARGGKLQADGSCPAVICQNRTECSYGMEREVDGRSSQGKINAVQLCKQQANAAYISHTMDTTVYSCGYNIGAMDYLNGAWVHLEIPYCNQPFNGFINSLICDLAKSP